MRAKAIEEVTNGKRAEGRKDILASKRQNGIIQKTGFLSHTFSKYDRMTD
jgi:hypothetical protein